MPEEEPTFTQAQLTRLESLEFKRPCLVRLLAERCDLADEFHRHLLSIEFDPAVSYDLVMRAHGGDPSGVEYRRDDRESWAFVLPDASQPGMHRIQYFDQHGFSSHHPCESVAKAADTMVTEGFRVRDDGALDRIGCLASFKRGTEVASLIQLLNRSVITMSEFNERRALLV